MKRKRKRPRATLEPIPSVATCYDAKSRLSDETVEQTYRAAKAETHLTQGEAEGISIVRHKKTTQAVRNALGLVDAKTVKKQSATKFRSHNASRKTAGEKRVDRAKDDSDFLRLDVPAETLL